MPEGILADLRVVEVSAYIAAPLGGAVLSSLGAQVIRVEQLGGGVDARRWPVHEGRSLYRAGLDRGKASFAVDLRSPRGQQLVTELATAPGDNAGIVLTNLPAHGFMDYERLRERRPDLIMVIVTGSPDGTPALDYTVNAGIGFPFVTGAPGTDGPVNHVLPAWDISTAIFAATALLAAERHRRATGAGQRIDIALSDVGLAIADHLGFLAEAALVETPRARFGNEVYGTFGRDFRTGDGHFAMVCAFTPRQWNCLVEATDLGAACGEIEERHGIDLRDEEQRFFYRGEINALLEPWFAARTLHEVREIFDDKRVLWGPYRTFKEFLRDHPEATDPFASPLAFSGFPRTRALPAPRTGAHTEKLLAEVLGLNTAELDELREQGVID